MIRIDEIWLSTQPMDMRARMDTAMAQIMKAFGSIKPHCAYLFCKALLHKHSKAEFSPIHSNLSDNLGLCATLFRKSSQNCHTRMNLIDLTLQMSCGQLIS